MSLRTRTPARVKRTNRSVFINCPFDASYLVCFEAIVFTVYMSGYQPVCALEEDNFGDVRLDKLTAMIARCDRTIHDLSRTESNDKGLPRFNMPFELGIAVGGIRYGGRRQRRKRVLVMIKKPYIMAQFLSDAAGNDPRAHLGKPAKVIEHVRNHLRYYYSPNGKKQLLPGAQHFHDLFAEFKRDLPGIAKRANLTKKEIDSFEGGYLDFLEMLTRFAQIVMRASRPITRP